LYKIVPSSATTRCVMGARFSTMFTLSDNDRRLQSRRNEHELGISLATVQRRSFADVSCCHATWYGNDRRASTPDEFQGMNKLQRFRPQRTTPSGALPHQCVVEEPRQGTASTVHLPILCPPVCLLQQRRDSHDACGLCVLVKTPVIKPSRCSHCLTSNPFDVMMSKCASLFVRVLCAHSCMQYAPPHRGENEYSKFSEHQVPGRKSRRAANSHFVTQPVRT